jgi:nicotinamide-nucleotide amidase
MGDDLPDDADKLAEEARELLMLADASELKIATAESCTGGLLASLLTDIEGLSNNFERGFVTYTDEAKSEMLGIELDLVKTKGAVSAEVAEAMARGALEASGADLEVSITGFAGKGKDPADEPGKVFIAAQCSGAEPIVREFHFGDLGREEVRKRTASAAIHLLREALCGAKSVPVAAA